MNTQSNKLNQTSSSEHNRKSDPLLDFLCMGNSKESQDLKQQITFAKKAPHTTILLIGESGCGKEALARHLWAERRRTLNQSEAQAPFLAVNMAAIPESIAESILFGHQKGAFTSARDRQFGKFELAKDGVLFLDEIQSMSLSLQQKILRVIQEKEVDPLGCRKSVKLKCQIILATNFPLEKLVDQNRFRLDLYYRLALCPIYMPPLRNRAGDLAEYVEFFIEKITRELGQEERPTVHDDYLKCLYEHSFPGNLRELEHGLYYSILRSKQTLMPDSLAPWIGRRRKEFIEKGNWFWN